MKVKWRDSNTYLPQIFNTHAWPGTACTTTSQRAFKLNLMMRGFRSEGQEGELFGITEIGERYARSESLYSHRMPFV